MKKFYLLLFLFISNEVFSQSTFVHRIIKDPLMPGIDITGTQEGGYLIVSTFETPGPGWTLAKAVMKVNSSGNIIWKNYYNPSCDLLPYYRLLQETSDSGFYLGLLPDLGCMSGLSWKVSRFDKNGNCLWTILDEQPAWDDWIWIHDLKKDKYSDDFMVVGGTSLPSLETSFINKYDSNGLLLFSKEFNLNGPLNHYLHFNKCQSFYDSGGNLTEYLTVGGGHLQGISKGCLLRLSPVGNIDWIKLYSNQNPPFIDITKIESNYYLLSESTGNTPGYLSKIDINGTPVFSLRIDSVRVTQIEKADSTHVLIIGSLGKVTQYPVIIELDTSGNITRVKYNPLGFYENYLFYYDNYNTYYDENTKAIYVTYRNTFNEEFVEKLYMDSSCNFRDTVLNTFSLPVLTDTIVTDPFTSHTTAVMDSVITAYPNSDSLIVVCSTSTGISLYESSQVGLQLFPNPASDFITVFYSLHAQKNISISLFNLYGQKLKTLFEGMPVPNKQEMSFDVKDLPQGIYFVKLKTDGFEEVKKVVKY